MFKSLTSCTCVYAYKTMGMDWRVWKENRDFIIKSNKVDVDVVLINPCPNYLTLQLLN